MFAKFGENKTTGMESTILTKKKSTAQKNIDIIVGDQVLKGARPPMTDEEFFELCRNNPDARIEQDQNGNISLMSPVSYNAGNFEAEILGDLIIWNRKYKLGKTFSPSTLFVLPDGQKRMPDAAWVSNEKHEKLPAEEREQFAAIVPDFVIEVRSPSDDLAALRQKMTDAWLANGVRLAWLIDPVGKKAWSYKPGREPIFFENFDAALSGEDVLPGFELNLPEIMEE